jgi:hypothetical protein
MTLALLVAYTAGGCREKKEANLVPPVIKSAISALYAATSDTSAAADSTDSTLIPEEAKTAFQDIISGDESENPYVALEERVRMTPEEISHAKLRGEKSYSEEQYTVVVRSLDAKGTSITITHVNAGGKTIVDTSYVRAGDAELVPHDGGKGITCIYSPEKEGEEEFYIIFRENEGILQVTDKGFVLPGDD